jgi:nicotinate phosphoribosyltransferase
VNPVTSALLTDLYQLTMLQAYFDHGMDATAVFEFFVRKLPAERNFLIAAGLEQAIEFLEQLHFTGEELEWLRKSGRFSATFVDSLEHLRFSGDVDAMPEGTVFFPDEPILRVVAPIREAQLAESRVINLLHFQTLIASKAARSVLAAPGKLLVDFGLRLQAARVCGQAIAQTLRGEGHVAGAQAGVPGARSRLQDPARHTYARVRARRRGSSATAAGHERRQAAASASHT